MSELWECHNRIVHQVQSNSSFQRVTLIDTGFRLEYRCTDTVRAAVRKWVTPLHRQIRNMGQSIKDQIKEHNETG